MSRHGVPLAVFLLLAGASPARAADTDPDATATSTPAETPPPPVSQTFSGAAITRPEGGYLRYDWTHEIGTTSHWRWGAFSSWLVYSDEVGLQLDYVARPEWLSVSFEAAAEPGFFIRLPDAGLPAGAAEPSHRDLRWRQVARTQANVNLRVGGYWLYDRLTLEGRWRSFREYDEFEQVELEKNEYSVENAFAPIFRVASHDDATFWVYSEYTIGGVWRVGRMPNRVSLGTITEDWLVKGLDLDLDGYWSFAPNPGPGPGVILAWWYGW